MLYKYPSDKQMVFNREFNCYFDYIIVDGDSADGYSKEMKEAKAPKKTVRKTRKKATS